MRKRSLVITALCLCLLPAAASAELLRGPYEYPSAISFDGQIGTQVSLGGFTPGGFKLVLDYSHRFTRTRDGRLGVWFFGDLGIVGGPGGAICGSPPFECGPIGYGSDFEVRGGIQLTFRTPVPLVPYIKMGVALSGVFGRDCNDTGVGVPLLAAGGGVRYFFTRHIAINAGVDLHLGPAFYSGGDGACFRGQHVELWRSLSFLAGVTYAL